MTIEIGTLLRNKKSGSMAIVLQEMPLISQEIEFYARFPQLAAMKNITITEHDKYWGKQRLYTIKEDLGDKWEDKCFIVKRLTHPEGFYFAPYHTDDIPYHHSRIEMDWEVVE